VLDRSRPQRLRLTRADRLLWVWISRVWNEWRAALVIVRPETVITWHNVACCRCHWRSWWNWLSEMARSS